MQARQGDIFFNEVKKTAKGKKLESNILAYGEVTGHAHKIFSPPLSELESVVAENGDIYVMSPHSPVTITHDEHGSIELPMGKWFCVTRQREYDPVAQLIKKVQD